MCTIVAKCASLVAAGPPWDLIIRSGVIHFISFHSIPIPSLPPSLSPRACGTPSSTLLCSLRRSLLLHWCTSPSCKLCLACGPSTSCIGSSACPLRSPSSFSGSCASLSSGETQVRGGERGGCRDGALTEDRNTTASEYDSLTSKKRFAPMLLGLRHRTPWVVGLCRPAFLVSRE